jgi:hypothetical protein
MLGITLARKRGYQGVISKTSDQPKVVDIMLRNKSIINFYVELLLFTYGCHCPRSVDGSVWAWEPLHLSIGSAGACQVNKSLLASGGSGIGGSITPFPLGRWYK